MLITRGVVFFIAFALFWYFAKTNNLFGLGQEPANKADAAKSAVLMAIVATPIYVLLLYLWQSIF